MERLVHGWMGNGFGDEKLHGPVFVLNGTRYLHDDASRSWYVCNDLYGKEMPSPLSDSTLIEQLNALQEEDDRIVRNWVRLAEERACGDSTLKDLLLRSISYNQGELPSPRMFGGVEYWPVGHNASHNFFASFHQGIKRVLCAEPCDDDTEEIEVYVLETGEDWGYLGHY